MSSHVAVRRGSVQSRASRDKPPRPKSSTSAFRRAPVLVTMMFSGFKSRWMTPRACAQESASSTCVMRCTVSAPGEAALAREDLLQRRAGDVLEDRVEPAALGLARVEQADDVGVRKPGAEP